MTSLDSEIWAITTFFNPAGYRQRYQNFRIFREHLSVPLVAVELGYGNDFELKDGRHGCVGAVARLVCAMAKGVLAEYRLV
jgi:hypothetical protein